MKCFSSFSTFKTPPKILDVLFTNFPRTYSEKYRNFEFHNELRRRITILQANFKPTAIFYCCKHIRAWDFNILIEKNM